MTPELKGYLLVTIAKVVGVFTAVMLGVTYSTWLERRESAIIQDRLGPNRVGKAGLLQPWADAVKNMMKEETYPAMAQRWLFIAAPAIALFPALMTFAVIPFGSPLPPLDITLPVLGQFVVADEIPLVVADLPIGFLYILALTSLGVYGIALAGWASNNKYSLLGGLRASAQMVSYELALGLGVLVVLLLAGNVRMGDIVAQQQASLWFVLPLFVGFVIVLVSSFAETNRLPFDMPEAEAELIAGYHAEYSSMKFSMFFIAEYANMITAAGLIVTLFFGGWDIPFWARDNAGPYTWWVSLLTISVFFLKIFFFMFLFVWVRWTLPRFRYDQLMALGWKFLLPLSLVYIIIIAVTVYVIENVINLTLGVPYAAILVAINAVLAFIVVRMIDRGRIITGAAARKEAA